MPRKIEGYIKMRKDWGVEILEPLSKGHEQKLRKGYSRGQKMIKPFLPEYVEACVQYYIFKQGKKKGFLSPYSLKAFSLNGKLFVAPAWLEVHEEVQKLRKIICLD